MLFYSYGYTPKPLSFLHTKFLALAIQLGTERASFYVSNLIYSKKLNIELRNVQQKIIKNSFDIRIFFYLSLHHMSNIVGWKDIN